ncbi:MAG: glycerol-3-phosphate acyltransferase [Candidatus Cloacimonetes bacterium]|nr:glycerol-3-phosphate acyltransferase [Candidatus Cloacimonadota bacterium]
MSDTLTYILLMILSYAIGCWSTARLIAKTFRSLNIYKVGTGHPDTQNIYCNIDKSLGIFAGFLDFSKIYIYLFILKLILNFMPYTAHLTSDVSLLALGFMMLLGHCLPVTHKFKGGRGVFTYMGLVMFFAPIPMLISGLIALIITLRFEQHRFVQYLVVIMPAFLNLIFEKEGAFISMMFVLVILMAIINVFVSRRRGEI